MKIITMVLLVSATSLGCQQKLDLKQVAEKIQEKAVESTKEEEKKEPIFNLLSKLTLEEIKHAVAVTLLDEAVQHYDISLTPTEIELKRQGVDCVKCNANAEDPNMRSN